MLNLSEDPVICRTDYRCMQCGYVLYGLREQDFFPEYETS